MYFWRQSFTAKAFFKVPEWMDPCIPKYALLLLWVCVGCCPLRKKGFFCDVQCSCTFGLIGVSQEHFNGCVAVTNMSLSSLVPTHSATERTVCFFVPLHVFVLAVCFCCVRPSHACSCLIFPSLPRQAAFPDWN